jgi:hypothetical protein
MQTAFYWKRAFGAGRHCAHDFGRSRGGRELFVRERVLFNQWRQRAALYPAGIAGTLSGVVESDGYIRLGDLVSFEAKVYFNNVDSRVGAAQSERSFALSIQHSGGPASLFVKSVHSSPNF